MTIVVPPWGGPLLGETLVMSGPGQFPDVVAKSLPVQASATSH